MKPAIRPLNRLLRDLFRVEPLEARVLLSADPVLGAAQIVLSPPEQDAAAVLAEAYAAPADVKVATTPGATVLVANGASQQAVPAQWLLVDTAQLADGNGRVVVGGPDSNAVIHVGTADSEVHLGELVLVNPQAGGEIFLDGALHLKGSLLIQGSGHTTIVSADASSIDDISIADSVVIQGNRTLEAGTDGSGNIQLGANSLQTLNGNSDATADTLVLRAADNVHITGPVGGTDPLEGLTIEAVSVAGSPNLPANVKFDAEVTINGDLLINATGTVTFTGKVILTSGGDLRITGADKVIFAAGVELQGTDGLGAAGDLFIEANEIDFTGGGSESVKGQGVLTLRPTLVTNGIDIGSLPAIPSQPPATTLNLDTSELKMLADGFSRIVIGQQDGLHANAAAGAVRIGAIDALSQPTLRDPLEVYGGSISVEDLDNPDYQLLVLGTIKLDARGDITLGNRIEANAGAGASNITLYSETGRIQQLDFTVDLRSGEPLRAATLTLHAATGISLPFTEIASVSAVNTASGDLTITETATGADVAITLLSQQAANAGITLKTTSGSINVDGTGIANAGSGATELQAAGAAKTITVTQAITSAAGMVKLTATGGIVISDNGTSTDGTISTGGAANIDLLATAGSISQGANITSAGGAISLDAFTTLAMVDGVHATSLHPTADTGAVSLRARGGNLTVSIVEADGTMALTASGSILDGLTGNNPNLDGETAAVLLAAASGIGASSTPLQTRVGTLAAGNTTSGGLFVREATALRLAGGLGGFAVDLAGSNGSMAIVTVDGAITVDQALRSTGTVGHLLLQSGEAIEATAAGITVRANVSSAQGSLTVLAADGIVVDDLAAGASTISVASATQTMDVEAADGIAMEAQARFATAGGAARLRANGGDIALGIVDVGSGNATLSATGAIFDVQADDGNATPTANVVAGSARLAAGANLGVSGALVETQVATLAASAGAALFVAERDNLSVGSVAAVSVNRVGALGTIASNPADAGALAGIASGAALVLQAGGNLSVDQAIAGAGHLRVAATGTMNVATTVASTGGNLSAIAAGTLTMTAAGVFSSSTGSIDLQSTGGAIAMADGAVAWTNAATIRAQAAGDVTVGLLDARSAADRAGNTMADALSWGSVSVVAGAAIADNAGETTTDIYGHAVRLQAAGGVGTATEKLETEAGQLSASAGAAGLFLTEASALDLSPLAAIGVQRVGADGASAAGPVDAAQAGLASGGALVVQTQLGSIVSSGSATIAAAGNLLLDAQGGASLIDLGAAASSSGGSLSLQAAQDVLLNASVSTAAAGKTIDVRAGRHVTQAQGASVATNNGNIALEAVAGNVTLETATAGSGGVWVSGTNIVDGDAAGDTEVDIAAASAQLLATGGIAAAGAALETQVATITASAGTGVFVTESDGLAVDRLQLNVDRIGAAGGAIATAHAAQEDLSAQTVVLSISIGDLTLNAGTAGTAAVNGGSGNVRLDALAGNLLAAATVNAGSGSVSMLAGSALTIQAGAGVTTTGGTIDLESTGGGIAMADGALAQTGGGSVRLKAVGNVTVGRVDAGAGSISIAAGGMIADNPLETNVDVVAGTLRLQAGNGIGTGTDALETDVAQLSATAGAGGVFLLEATGITVTQTAAVSVNRVGTDGTTLTAQTDGVQAGLTSGGALVLQTTNGTLSTTAQGAVGAAGNVLLKAGGATSDLAIVAAVSSSGGNVHLAAGQDALLGAGLSTTTAGKSVVVEAGRNLTQSQGTAIATVNGGIDLEAAGTITIETLTAGSAGVMVSGGNIVDGDAAGDSEVDIVANRALLVSGNGIGAAGAQLETTVDTVRAYAVNDIFLTETDAVALDVVSVSYERIDGAGAVTDVTSTALPGLYGRNIVLRTLNGGITSIANASVAATGNLLLQAGGATADLALGATTSAAGALSLAAGRDVTLTSSVSTTTAGSSVDIQAVLGRIDAQQGSAIVANNGNVQLLASGSVTLETIGAGTGTVRISGTSIVDGDSTPGETEVDITADKLLLTGSAAGTGANPLETSVTTLTVSATGTVGIVDSTGLVLGTVTASVDRVGTDGTTTATAPVTQSNVTGSTITLRTLAGSLVASASGAVTATGDLLLKALGASGDIGIAAAVSSSGGNITLDAARDLSQGANITTAAAGRSVDLLAGGNLEQLQGSAVATNNGHASLAATGTLTIETVSAGVGRVSLSGASLVDGDAAGDTEVDVLAAGLRATATAGGIGSAANALETTISTLSAVATGDVFVTETDALDLAVVSVTVNRVASNGSNAPVILAGQSNVSGATVVVRTLGGSLTSQATGAASATGNLLLQAGGATSDLNLAGTVASSGGHVSLAAGQDMLLGANVSAAGSGKSVDLVAGRNFLQNQGTLVSSADGNIGLLAAGSATIETFNAGAGQLRIAAASIVDGDVAPGETEVDLIGSAAQLVTTGAVGTSGNALETSVQTLAAATGDLYLAETDALTVGALAVDTQRVDATGAAAATANASTSGITAAIAVVQAKAGSIDSLAGIAVNASGNLLLKATGAGSDIFLRGALTGGGFATLDAGHDLVTQSAVTLTTAGRSLVLQAGRDFVQAEGASATTSNGAIALTAIGNATLDTLSAGTGAVRITAANVIDGDADGDTEVDVDAGGLQVATGGAVGTATNALEISAATFTLQATGAAFLAETDALLLGSVSVATQRVGTDGTAQPLVTSTQGNVTGGATLVLRTLGGTLTSNGQGVVTAAGNLLLAAGGATSDLGLNAAVSSSGGNLSLAAGQDLVLGANVATAATGATIDLLAGRNAVQAQGTSASTVDGNIALDAAGTATLETLAAGSAGVWVNAAAIVDGDAAADSEVDISAASALLRATGAIGAAGAALETSVATLAAQAGGNLFVTESTGLTIGSLAIDVMRVNADATVTLTAHAGLAGLAGANTVLRTVDGALAVQQAVAATGKLLLQAGGAAGDLGLGADVTAAGALSLAAGRDLAIGNAVTTSTAGSTIDLQAQGALTAAEGSSISASNANVLLAAGGNVTLESVSAGTGSVRITGAGLIDGDTAGDSEADIAAAQLQVAVTGAVGAAGNALETTVGTLSVAAGGAIVLGESDALVIGAASFTGVDRVGADSATTGTGTVAQADVLSTGGVITLAAAGDLALAAQARVASTGGDVTLSSLGALTLGAQAGVASSGAAMLSGTGDISLATLATVAAAGNITLATPGALTLADSVTVSTTAGTILLDAGAALAIGDSDDVHTDSGNVTLDAGAALSLGASASVDTDAGTATLTAQGDLSLGTAASVDATGAIALTTPGAVTLADQATVTSTGGPITLDAGTTLALGADASVVTGSGNVLLQAAAALSLATGASVTTGSGDVTLVAGGALALDADAAVAATGGTARLLAYGGDLSLGAAAGVAASGAVTLTSVSGLTLAAQATVTSTGGAVTLDADGSIGIGADAAVGTSSGDVTLHADAALALGTNAAVTTGAGSIILYADTALTLDTDARVTGAGPAIFLFARNDLSLGLRAAVAGTGSILLNTPGGAILLASQATVSSTGGSVRLDAGTAVGLGASASVSTTTGNVDVEADAALSLGVNAAVTTGSGNVTLAALGDLALGNAATVTASGAVGITADGVTLGTAAQVVAGGALSLTAQGNVALGLQSDLTSIGSAGITLSAQGTLALASEADIASGGGAIALSANGSITMADQADVRTGGAATIDVTSVTGSVLMDPNASSLQTGSGDIHITAEGDIRPGALITAGKAFLDARNGRILIQGDLQRNGEDIDLFADDLVISVPVSSPGGTLRIGPLDPGTAIVIGDAVPAGPALQVDTGELALLQDGFAQIVIGSSLANTAITLDGATSPLVFRDPLVLTATGAGGSVAVNGSLTGDTLTIADAGSRTSFNQATVRMQGSVLVQDQLTINGPTSLTAGLGGSGDLRFTQSVTGQGGAGDTLALAAQGGNVQFDQAVGNLDGMTVTGAADVRFGAGLSLDGDLVIDATGTVTFAGPVTLNNGARLIIRGTANVVFASSANFGSGAVTIATAAIAATGGTGSLTGQGQFLLQGTTPVMAIHIGTGAPAGALQVGDDILRAIGSGFTVLRLGTGAEAVTIGDSDFSRTGAPVQVDASTISIAATGAGVRVTTGFTLHATGAITASGRVSAGAAADLTLRSDSAAITMAAGAQLRSLGGNIVLDAATGLAVAGLDARAGGGAAGTVMLRTASGVVVDANQDTGVDIYARGVTLAGLGPAMGGGDVLEVAAQLVRVDTPDGVVVRETGTDGRTYFNVLRGSDLVQALVAVGGASRVTSDVDAFIAGGGLQSLASSAPPSSALQALLMRALPSALAPVNTGVQVYLAGGAQAAAIDGLTLSQRLLSESDLSFATGQPAGSGSAVDYWSESVSV